jgi:hypothetical protein
MAVSGEWSNVGDWLLSWMLHERNARVLVHCGRVEHHAAFRRELASAFKRFADLPLEARGGLGLIAVDIQRTIRSLLVQQGCVTVAPCDTDHVLVLPVEQAKKSQPRSLVVGISVTNPLTTDTSAFKRVCQYNPYHPSCPLPPLPVNPLPQPPPLVVLPHRVISVNDDDEEDGEGIFLISIEEDKEESVEEKAKTNADDSFDVSGFFSTCPICLEIPFPPWHTTSCGHLICVECHAALPNRNICPSCKQSCAPTLVPQFLFANVANANNVKLPCRHEGCKRRIPWDAARRHHAACQHRPQKCPYAKKQPLCGWEGSIESMGDHLVNVHEAVSVTDRELTLAGVLGEASVMWKSEQIVLMVDHIDSLGMHVQVISLRYRDVFVNLTINLGEDYSGTSRIKARTILSNKPWTTLILPCVSSTQLVEIVATCESVAEASKKRMREGSEEEEPAAKEARIDVEEKDDMKQ